MMNSDIWHFFADHIFYSQARLVKTSFRKEKRFDIFYFGHCIFFINFFYVHGFGGYSLLFSNKL